MAREAVDAARSGDLDRARIRAAAIARSMGEDARSAVTAVGRGIAAATQNRMIGRAPVNRGER